jgi:hypothetical protein
LLFLFSRWKRLSVARGLVIGQTAGGRPGSHSKFVESCTFDKHNIHTRETKALTVGKTRSSRIQVISSLTAI